MQNDNYYSQNTVQHVHLIVLINSLLQAVLFVSDALPCYYQQWQLNVLLAPMQILVFQVDF